MKKLFVLVLAALLLAFIPFSFAASIEKKDIKDEAGNVITMTVTAPYNHDVDKRIFMDADDDKSKKPLDVSGYQITLKAKTVLGCKGWQKLYNPVPVVLQPKSQVTIQCDFCESIGVAAYPVTGNVDVKLCSSNGKGDNKCWQSHKPKNRLDATGIYWPGCVNDSYINTVYITNQYAEPATFVSYVDIFFTN